MKLTTGIVNKVKNFTKREQIMIVVFIVVAVCTFYYKYIYEPQIAKINELTNEITTQEKLLSTRLNQGWDDIPWLKERSQEVKLKIEDFYIQAPNIADEPNLLLDMYHIAKDNHLQRDVIKFSEIKKAENKEYSTIEVSMRVFGNNANIYNFISNVENYNRMNRITQISFDPKTSLESICTLTIEYYILHKIKPDPLNYPFMEGEYGKDKPYQIFDVYIEEFEDDFNGIEIETETGLDNLPEESEAPNSLLPSQIKSSSNDSLKWLLPVPQWIQADE